MKKMQLQWLQVTVQRLSKKTLSRLATIQAMVWSVVVHGGSLYVQSDTETQFSLGPILGIQASKDKTDCIKVSYHNKFSCPHRELQQRVQAQGYSRAQI